MSYNIYATQSGLEGLPTAVDWSYDPPWIFNPTPEQIALLLIQTGAASPPGPSSKGRSVLGWWVHPEEGVVTGVVTTQNEYPEFYVFEGTYTRPDPAQDPTVPTVTSFAAHPVTDLLTSLAVGSGELIHQRAFGVLMGDVLRAPPFWTSFVYAAESLGVIPPPPVPEAIVSEVSFATVGYSVDNEFGVFAGVELDDSEPSNVVEVDVIGLPSVVDYYDAGSGTPVGGELERYVYFDLVGELITGGKNFDEVQAKITTPDGSSITSTGTSSGPTGMPGSGLEYIAFSFEGLPSLPAQLLIEGTVEFSIELIGEPTEGGGDPFPF